MHKIFISPKVFMSALSMKHDGRLIFLTNNQHETLMTCKKEWCIPSIPFVYDDGGRKAAGFRGIAGDCVCRAICIATQLEYNSVYERLAEGNATQRRPKRERKSKTSGVRSARNGIYTSRKWFKDYMTSLGFQWVSTMQIGSGCKVHLKSDELPKGRLVVRVSKHLCCVIDGKLHDTYDCSREGTRCVYGYWKLS